MSIGTEKHGLAGHESQPGMPPGKPPGKKWTLALAGLIGTFMVLAGYSISTNLGQIGARHVAAAAKTSRPTADGGTARSSGPVTATPGSASPGSASPAGTTASPASHPLGVASVVAFGPEGTAGRGRDRARRSACSLQCARGRRSGTRGDQPGRGLADHGKLV